MEDERAWLNLTAEPNGKPSMHAGMKDGAPRVSSRAADVSLLLLQELDRFDREVVILKHRVGLEIHEIALVLDREETEVLQRLAAIEDLAFRLAGSTTTCQEPSMSAS